MLFQAYTKSAPRYAKEMKYNFMYTEGGYNHNKIEDSVVIDQTFEDFVPEYQEDIEEEDIEEED